MFSVGVEMMGNNSYVRVRLEHRFYFAFRHAGHMRFKNVPHDNFRLITSRQLSMSYVPNLARVGIFVHQPVVHPTTGR